MSANDQATPSDAVPRKPRRRWLQVSLRTLLVVVTLLCIGLGWVVHRGERQRRAVAALKEKGGVVSYDWSPDSVGETPCLPPDYSVDVEIVMLFGKKVKDADMAHLKRLRGLRTLYLTSTQITDAGLSNLAGRTSLRGLNLRWTQVTDAGLPQLQG